MTRRVINNAMMVQSSGMSRRYASPSARCADVVDDHPTVAPGRPRGSLVRVADKELCQRLIGRVSPADAERMSGRVGINLMSLAGIQIRSSL